MQVITKDTEKEDRLYMKSSMVFFKFSHLIVTLTFQIIYQYRRSEVRVNKREAERDWTLEAS